MAVGHGDTVRRQGVVPPLGHAAAVVAAAGLLVGGVTGCSGGGRADAAPAVSGASRAGGATGAAGPALVDGDGDGGSGGGAGSTADAAEAVRRAPDLLMRARSSRTRTTMEVAVGGTRVSITGTGAYDFTLPLGTLRVTLPQGPAGSAEHRPITELLAPGALYMKNRGAGVPADKWVRVDTTTLNDGNLVTGGATDPVSAAELLRGVVRVTYIGAETIDGTKVRHYAGTTEMGRAAEAAPAYARGALAAAAKGFSSTAVPFDAYLDGAGRVRKIRHRFHYVNAPGRPAIEVVSTTVFYDFGARVQVRLPAPGDIYEGEIAEP